MRAAGDRPGTWWTAGQLQATAAQRSPARPPSKCGSQKLISLRGNGVENFAEVTQRRVKLSASQRPDVTEASLRREDENMIDLKLERARVYRVKLRQRLDENTLRVD